MSQLLKLALSLIAWIPAFLCQVTTMKEFAVLEGRSVTVPCHYDPQHRDYVKYWCRGRMRDFCTSIARTDATHSADPAEDKVTIFDDPAQTVFTVTMKDLKQADSGWYWCGVEVGNIWTADVYASTYINAIHGMSVVNSQVSGEEGSSVTVECRYSEKYRDSVKKWCRSGDPSSCLLTGSESSHEDTSVAISDDRTGAFTITLKELQMKDAGWYLCGAGQQHMSVQVQVTPRSSTTAVSSTRPPTSSPSAAYLPAPKHIAKEPRDTERSYGGTDVMGVSVIVCATLMLLLGMAILARKLWIEYKNLHRLNKAVELKADLSECPGDEGYLQNAAVVFLNKDPQSVHVF